MPAFDGTGPQGKGPLTGRGIGKCGKGKQIGQGFGFGQGKGRRLNQPGQIQTAEEIKKQE